MTRDGAATVTTRGLTSQAAIPGEQQPKHPEIWRKLA